jgi:hypothetical protein
MLFRFGPVHRLLGWLLTVAGVVLLAGAARGYLMGGLMWGDWVLAGLLAVVAGTSVIRWARRARPD